MPVLNQTKGPPRPELFLSNRKCLLESYDSWKKAPKLLLKGVITFFSISY